MDELSGEPVAMNYSSAEVISLDTMRSAMVANFEQADLDVPAFFAEAWRSHVSLTRTRFYEVKGFCHMRQYLFSNDVTLPKAGVRK